jgi:hypothetical protein
MTELDWLLAFTMKCIQTFLMTALGGLICLGVVSIVLLICRGLLVCWMIIYFRKQKILDTLGGKYDDWP